MRREIEPSAFNSLKRFASVRPEPRPARSICRYVGKREAPRLLDQVRFGAQADLAKAFEPSLLSGQKLTSGVRVAHVN
jgi:hypothetical protein